MSIVKELYHSKKIKHITPYIIENIQYETRMGSVAYGVSNNTSDVDLYSFTIPPRNIVFPHTVGHIPGFGKAPEKFDVFQMHHIQDGESEYDVNVYNIVKYFSLCADNNPNMIDSLFVRDQSITFSTKIGQMVRDSRKDFLHRGAWHRFRGYAYAQMKKIRAGIDKDNKNNRSGKRKELIEKHGYDVKHAYHVVRLMNEIEQILVEGDIDLMANNDQLKDIRAGNWTFEQVESWFYEKEKSLEKLYTECSLPKFPDEEKLKILLLNCLEEFYGTITTDDVGLINQHEQAIHDIKKIIEKL